MTQKSKEGDLWTPFGDVAVQQVRAINERTGELRSVVFNQVKPSAGVPTVIGLRRYQLEELPNGNFRETGTEANSKDVFAQLVDFHRNHSYLYDPPNIPLESKENAAEKAAIKAIIEQQMAAYPFEFTITGLQRRYLWYFHDSPVQKLFQTLSFLPDSQPFTESGELRPRYRLEHTAAMQAAGARPNAQWVQDYGNGQNLSKCLYRGPAWVVRFALDGQDVLPSCRAYVRDDGMFIASDWCQRHDFTTYNQGVNLQCLIFTLGEWIFGSVLQKMGRSFVPKNGGKTEVVKMSAAIAQGIAVVPTMEDLLDKHIAAEKANIPKDALPIVPDVLIPEVISEEVSLAAEQRAREHYTRMTLKAMQVAEQRRLLESFQRNGKFDGSFVEIPTTHPTVMHVTDQGTLVTTFIVPENAEQRVGPAIMRAYRIDGARARPGHEEAQFIWCGPVQLFEQGTGMATVKDAFEKVKKTLEKKPLAQPAVEDTDAMWWLGLDKDESFLYGGAYLNLIDGIEPCLKGWHGHTTLEVYKSDILPALMSGAANNQQGGVLHAAR